MLIVAHDARIVPFADRVYYMEDGRLEESGRLEGLIPKDEWLMKPQI